MSERLQIICTIYQSKKITCEKFLATSNYGHLVRNGHPVEVFEDGTDAIQSVDRIRIPPYMALAQTACLLANKLICLSKRVVINPFVRGVSHM